MDTSPSAPAASSLAPPERGTGKANRRQWVSYFIARLDGVPPRLRDMGELLRRVGHTAGISTVRGDYVALGMTTGRLRPMLNHAARSGAIPHAQAASIFPTVRQLAAAFVAAQKAASLAASKPQNGNP